MDKNSNIANIPSSSKEDILEKYKSSLNVKAPEPFKQGERYSVKDFERWMDKVTAPQEGYFNRTTELPRGFLKQEEFKKRELVDVNNDVLLDDVTRRVREDIVNENFLKDSLNSENEDFEPDEILSVNEINNYIDESISVDPESLVVNYRMELNKKSDVVNNFKRVNSKYENFDEDSINSKIDEINQYNSDKEVKTIPFEYMTKYTPERNSLVDSFFEPNLENKEKESRREGDNSIGIDNANYDKSDNGRLNKSKTKESTQSDFGYLENRNGKSYKDFVYSDKSDAKNLNLIGNDDFKNVNFKKSSKYHHSIFTKVADRNENHTSKISDDNNLNKSLNQYIQDDSSKKTNDKKLKELKKETEDISNSSDFLNIFKEIDDKFNSEEKINSEKLVSKNFIEDSNNNISKESNNLKKVKNNSLDSLNVADKTLNYIFDNKESDKNQDNKSEDINVYGFNTNANNSNNEKNKGKESIDSTSLIFNNKDEIKNHNDKISDSFVSTKLID
ncbi:MAG: hypothetical protein HRS57_02310, partial [Mycoplasmataceae bacterium]|nr:hypothetical protein [Mycoplasmataceae bacterium]